jgi:N-acetylneuraminic acid mutarotase
VALAARPAGPGYLRGMRRALAIAVLALLLGGGLAGAASPRWRSAAPVPLPRTEVSAAVFGREIGVVGGFRANGQNSSRADAYSPARNRWRRLPSLPVRVDHAMAAGRGRELYLVGGYGPNRAPLASAFALRSGRWTSLPSMPAPRAAAGAAVAAGKLYVVGGIGPSGLAQEAFAYDFAARRWSVIAGPRPREHLGAAALGGRVYAVAGRTAGLDTNLDVVEVYDASANRWRAIPRVPDTRGGTAAAAVAGRLLSVGGEAPNGTIRTVYAYNPGTGRWSRLPDLPRPVHGLGLVGYRGRAYALAGGPQPGLTVSSVNQVLRVGS